MVDSSISVFSDRKATRAGYSSKIGSLFLTKMLSNPNYETVITTPHGDVKGFSEGPFAWQAKANYKPVADLGSIEDAASTALTITQLVGGASYNDVNPELLTQRAFKSIRASELRWAGSSSPVFQVKLILPSYDSTATVTPRDYLLRLFQTVYPEYDSEITMKAPGGYQITPGDIGARDTATGTCSLRKGKFFLARHLVLTSVSVEVSQEMMEDGQPLYFAANVELVPWRMPSWKDVSAYLPETY